MDAFLVGSFLWMWRGLKIMKAIYTVIWKTKAEARNNVQPATVPPQSFPSAYKAQQQFVGPVDAGTVSYAELYGPNGLIRRKYNPAGA
jgi:hypothetical protein